MKKPYQIEAQRAVKQLEEMAGSGNPAVQMVLPMAEMLGWLRQGVGELIRQAGLQLMSLLMEEEVRHLVGERNRPLPERTANRWGTERGYCVVMGQKVPVERPRVRSTEDREIRLGSYEMFHRGEPLTETVWEKLMLGLSTRKYGQAVREFSQAYGLEKSAISEHFIEASRAKLKELMERRLEKKKFCALLIDATPFEGQHMIAALGIGHDPIAPRGTLLNDQARERNLPAALKTIDDQDHGVLSWNSGISTQFPSNIANRDPLDSSDHCSTD